ncbi:MAG: helix-turn-helix transcriptional regulator [Bryobacterales bacterium]|nr:helix-turn-helix transcriptional regulator [Bryobacterales bacterium]MCZ2156983.1 PadR family transcriptional regulator [Bryobacterales bacterium]
MTNKQSKRKRKSPDAESTRGERRTFYAGLIRLHVLHHAAIEPVYGLGMIEELRRHGYDVSAGTLYPVLHGLERKGLLKSSREQSDGVERRLYRATTAGRKELAAAKAKVRELFGELFEHESGRL